MGVLHNAWHYGHVTARALFYGPPAIAAGAIFRDRTVPQHLMHLWCRGCTRGLGIDLTIYGSQRLDGLGQVVFLANHLSHLDIVVLGSVLDRDYRWLAKDAVFKVPIMGWHLSAAGHIPVYRGARKEKNANIGDRIQRVIEEEGASLFFFPEGTRSPDGELRPFKLGAFMAAVRGDLPVVPLVVRGTHALMDRNTANFSVTADRRCSVTVLPPITGPGEGSLTARARALRAQAYGAFVRELYPDAEVRPGQEAAEERPSDRRAGGR